MGPRRADDDTDIPRARELSGLVAALLRTTPLLAGVLQVTPVRLPREPIAISALRIVASSIPSGLLLARAKTLCPVMNALTGPCARLSL